MVLKVKRLHPDAIIPKYAKTGDSGFDLVAIEDTVIAPTQTRLIKTGIAIEIPEGFEMQIRPRSGTSLNTQLRVANAPGTVDSGFRGECCIILQNTNIGGTIAIVKKGDRIAQGVICPVIHATIEEVEDLTETERGSSGFGSSGI